MAIIWMKSPHGSVFPVNASRKARLEARGFELVKGRPARAAAQSAGQPTAADAVPSSEQDKAQEEPKKPETKKSGAKAK